MCSVPGQGSTFGFTLTFEKAPQGSTATNKTVSDPDPDMAAAVRGLRVLLVEDHDVNRQLVQLILANYEVAVDAAADGPTALKLFDQNSYHLILMDIQMPGMSGLEVTASIRQHPDPRKARIPIIALTANAFENESNKYLAAGMDDCLTKPFDEAELLRKMTALVRPGNGAPRSLFDLSELYQMAHGQKEFVRSIVDSFLEHTPQVVTQLAAATAVADWAQVGALVHKIKPSLKVLHAHELTEVVRILEDKATELTEGTVAAQQLGLLLVRLLSELKQWRQTQYY